MINQIKFQGYILSNNIRHDGGSGSGNFGHAGRPGEQGGSGESGGDGGGQIKVGMRVRTPYGEETVTAISAKGIHTKEIGPNAWYHPSKVSLIEVKGKASKMNAIEDTVAP